MTLSRLLILVSLLFIVSCSEDPASRGDSAADHDLHVVETRSGEVEQQLALAIEFAGPLDGAQSLDTYIDIALADGTGLEDRWILSRDGKTVSYPGVQAETRYRVTLNPGLRAASGEVLANRKEHEVLIGSMEPSVSFASRGSVLLRDSRAGLPIRTMNTTQVDVEFFRVRREQFGPFFSRYSDLGRTRAWAFGELNDLADSVYQQRFDTSGAANQTVTGTIPVQSIPELQGKGLYLALMRAAGGVNDSYATQLFTVSDLAVHARRYRTSTTVFVSSLASGAAVADAEVYLVNRDGERKQLARTDAQGHVTLPGPAASSDLLVVEREDDAAYLYLNRPALDLSSYPVTGDPWRPVEIFTWSSRDLFRPGNEFQTSLLVRDHDGRLTTLSELSYKLVRPDGRDAARGVLPLDKLGHASFSWQSSRSNPTGVWTLELRLDPASEQPDATHTLQVEEFLPERLEVGLSAPGGPFLSGEEIAFSVSGRYLYGAAATGNSLVLESQHIPLRQAASDWPGFEFGPLSDADVTIIELPDRKLDETGEAAVTVGSPAYPYPVIIRLFAAVLEEGGRSVERSASRRVWPTQQMPGIKPLFSDKRVSVIDPAAFEFILAHRDGSLLEDRELTIELTREDREYFWVQDDYGDWDSEFSVTRTTVEARNLTSGPGPVRADFELEPGWYDIAVTDDAGFTTTLSFTVGNLWQASGRTAVIPDKALIELDRESYRIGDTIEATLVSPHDGYAIVTLDADQTLLHRRLEVSAGENTLEIPLSDESWRRHDLYISAVIARRTSDSDRATPQRAVGIARVHLDRSDRQLAVTLRAPEVIRPLETLEVGIEVAELAGEEASVVLAVVDEGILNISGFETPQPARDIFEHRGYGADMHDLYHRVIERLDGAVVTRSYGGDIDAGRRAATQAEVRLLAITREAISLDENGKATVAIAIPDFTGAIRLMAVAYTENRFGAGDRTVLAQAPVTATVALPRFLSPGDEAVGVIELRNLTDETRTLSATLIPVGLELGATAFPETLKAGEKAVVRVPLQSTRSFGVAHLALALDSEDFAYEQQHEVAVRPAYPDERRLQWLEIPPGQGRALEPAWAEGFFPDSTSINISASLRPPLGLASAAEQLLRYPYGCLEQTVSSALPWLLLTPERQKQLALTVSFPEGMTPERSMNRTFEKLLSMQRSDGYFVLWDSSRSPERLMSAYAAEYLLDAAALGYQPPPGMLESLNEALAKGLTTGYWNFSSTGARFSYLAYASMVLARQSEITIPVLRGIREGHASDARTGLDKARLAVAFKLAGAEEEAQALFEDAMATARDDDYYEDYGSPLRDRLLKLALGIEHGLLGPERTSLLQDVSSEVRNRPYLSTQERIALLRLGIALGADDSAPALRVETAGQTGPARKTQHVALHGELPRADTRILNEADSAAFMIVDTAGFPLEPPTTQGKDFEVQHRIYDARGNAITDEQRIQGQVYYHHIAVRSTVATGNALLVALLPAGMELENPATSGRGTEEFRKRHLDVEDWYWSDGSVRHAEYRDDRYIAALELGSDATSHLVFAVRAVAEGQYRMPPVYVEDMYRPDRRTIAAPPAEAITVTARP